MRNILFILSLILFQKVWAGSVCLNDGLRGLVSDELDTHTMNMLNHYEKEFREASLETLKNKQALLISAYKNGEPHALHLYNMGFRFEKELVVPSFKDVMNYYQEGMQKLISLGRLDKRDVLEPVLVLEKFNKKSEKIFVKFGDKIPKDYHLSASGIVPEDVLVDLISSGQFPMGANRLMDSGSLGDGASEFIHDLAHYTAFLDYPDYLKIFKKLAIDERKGSEVFLEGFKGQHRAYIYELLQTVRPEKFGNLRTLLKVPDSSSGFVHIDTMKKTYKALDQEEVDRMIKELQVKMPQVMEYVGGGARDIISRGNFVHFRDNIHSLAANRSPLTHLDGLEELKNKDLAAQKEELAIIATLLDGLSQVSVSDILESYNFYKIKKGSRLNRFYKESGLYKYPRFYSHTTGARGLYEAYRESFYTPFINISLGSAGMMLFIYYYFDE